MREIRLRQGCYYCCCSSRKQSGQQSTTGRGNAHLEKGAKLKLSVASRPFARPPEREEETMDEDALIAEAEMEWQAQQEMDWQVGEQ